MTDEEAEQSAIPATRDVIIKEYADGSLAIKIIIDPKDKQRFLRLLPDPGLRIAFVRLLEEREKPAPAPKGRLSAPVEADKSPLPTYGKFAQALRLHIDWMGNPKVWEAFGTDEQYQEWCRDQPCAWCKKAPHWEMDTNVRSEAAHVRRAGESGTAFKAPFATIPLCHECHRRQHQHGERDFSEPEWFDQQRIKHVHAWLWVAMKKTFSVGSMRDLPPDDLLSYAEETELDRFLPDCYREAQS